MTHIFLFCLDVFTGGSGISLLHASKELDKLEITNSSQKIGVQIIQNALKVFVPCQCNL